MTISIADVGKKAEDKHKSAEAKATDRLGVILDRLVTRANVNIDDPLIEVVEHVLSIKPGGNEAIAKLLGIDTAPASDDEEKGKLKGYTPAYEHDGTPLGTGFKSEDEAKAAGFEPWLDVDGTLKGWRKPAPAALPTTTGDKVKVVDKHDRVLREIDRAEYDANVTDYDVVKNNDDGKAEKVREKSRIGFGRRGH